MKTWNQNLCCDFWIMLTPQVNIDLFCAVSSRQTRQTLLEGNGVSTEDALLSFSDQKKVLDFW